MALLGKSLSLSLSLFLSSVFPYSLSLIRYILFVLGLNSGVGSVSDSLPSCSPVPKKSDHHDGLRGEHCCIFLPPNCWGSEVNISIFIGRSDHFAYHGRLWKHLVWWWRHTTCPGDRSGCWQFGIAHCLIHRLGVYSWLLQRSMHIPRWHFFFSFHKHLHSFFLKQAPCFNLASWPQCFGGFSLPSICVWR